MKKTAIIAASLLTFVSCQEVLIEDRKDGAISVLLDNSPVVEVVTKTGTEEAGNENEDNTETVDLSTFNVYVNNGTATTTYEYGDLEGPISVPCGTYTVWADNVTEIEAHPSQGWGQIRYATAAPVEAVVQSDRATTVSLDCRMVNTAVSVIFEGSFSTYLQEGYNVKVYMSDDESRKLVYDATNTAGETPAVGYFKPTAAKLKYRFYGTDKNGNALAETGGELSIAAAKHYYLKFKVMGDGQLGLGINVITTCDPVYTDPIIVDPSQKAPATGE
jgi:hypothetical protein